MFRRVRAELQRVAGRFDPAVVDGRIAARMLDDVVAIKNSASNLEAMLAARVAETGGLEKTGARHAAEGLARRTGGTIKDARKRLVTGRRLRKLAATREAAARGELSPEQADAIADAASADPRAEGELLELAQRGSLQELRDACARVKARVIDLDARRRRIHAERSMRDWVDRDGRGHLHVTDNPERIASIASRLDKEAERKRATAPAGEREPLVAYRADALHDIVATASGEATNPGETAETGDEVDGKRRLHPDVKIRVRVDLPVLLRGYPMGDEVCEIVGYGPVPVSVILDLLVSADPFLAAIVTDGEQVAGVAHLGRRPTAKQQSALEWLYPTCVVEGCTHSTYLEYDHREDWARTHLTVLDWLDRPCSHHHDLKTHHGWALVEGRGKRPMVPQEDARHPRHYERANSPPAAA
jgi:hypothetical protein